jgi:hypothetical protein
LNTRSISVRLAKEDHDWIEKLARTNQIRVSAMVRALLHGVRIAAEQGELETLDMGRLALK